MGGKRWQGSASGPDWTDVRVYLREIAKAHQCSVKVEMSPDGAHEGPGLTVAVVAWRPSLDDGSASTASSVSSTFPHRQSATMEAMIFRLLFELDHLCGKALWEQSVLPLEER